MKIKAVKPKIWNFEVVKGEDAWKEVVYAARVSGVPSRIDGEKVLRMMIENDYTSVLEHVIIKFDIKMAKGCAPEILEHRMASHSGFSSRYNKADKGMLELNLEKQGNVYEIIMPSLLIEMENEDQERKNRREFFLEGIGKSIEAYEWLIDEGLPRDTARYALPFCQAVAIYHFTINLRSLLNLFSLRLCVRTCPEFHCLAAQMYFDLINRLPIIRGMVGCRGFIKGTCPEAGVTGVRKGESHPFYPPCLFRNSNSDIFIPTTKELRSGLMVGKFNKEKAIEAQEKVFAKWAKWEGE